MEWSKIKTLFIYLFLILNIILVCSYSYVIYKNNTEVYKEKDEIIKSIKNDDIDIVEPLLKREQLGYLNARVKELESFESTLKDYKFENISEDNVKKLKIILDKEITNIERDNYKDLLDAFVNAELSRLGNYVFSHYDTNKREVIYVQQIDDMKIFDNVNARVVFDVKADGEISSLYVTALEDFKKDKNDQLVTYLQVVYKLYHENNIPRNSRVTTQLGYYTYADKVNNQVLIPTYQVLVDNAGEKNYYFVDAVNLKILDQINK